MLNFEGRKKFNISITKAPIDSAQGRRKLENTKQDISRSTYSARFLSVQKRSDGALVALTPSLPKTAFQRRASLEAKSVKRD
jgi:hypothetical protein